MQIVHRRTRTQLLSYCENKPMYFCLRLSLSVRTLRLTLLMGLVLSAVADRLPTQLQGQSGGNVE